MRDKTRKVPFVEGNGLPFVAIKPNRNQPCTCGSGKKAKKCCGANTKYYLRKTKEQIALDKIEAEQKLQELLKAKDESSKINDKEV